MDVVGMSVDEAKLYAGHSLRMGGSNHIRRLGIADEVHRMLGGWASLTSSRHYFQLRADEQFAITRRMALTERCEPAKKGEKAVSLEAVRQLLV